MQQREAPIVTNRIILEAIARGLCFEANYNRTRFRLAPQILYTRHGEAYVDAVTLLKNGAEPRERKLASFKLSGLGGLVLTDEPSLRDPAFDPDAELYRDTTLFSLAG